MALAYDRESMEHLEHNFEGNLMYDTTRITGSTAHQLFPTPNSVSDRHGLANLTPHQFPTIFQLVNLHHGGQAVLFLYSTHIHHAPLSVWPLHLEFCIRDGEGVFVVLESVASCL